MTDAAPPCPTHGRITPIRCPHCTAHRVAELRRIATLWDTYATDCDQERLDCWPTGWGDPDLEAMAPVLRRHAKAARERAETARAEANALVIAHQRSRTPTTRRTP